MPQFDQNNRTSGDRENSMEGDEKMGVSMTPPAFQLKASNLPPNGNNQQNSLDNENGETEASIPEGGQSVNKIGLVAWDKSPNLRIRSSPETSIENNIIGTLPFNTRLLVIKSFQGGWYFVSTQSGMIGYVASDYVTTDHPDPFGNLHRVKGGKEGAAINIASKYYGALSDNWGQDLRFFVSVIGILNGKPVPTSTTDWENIHFKEGELIKIPSYQFAMAYKGIVNSGSMSYEGMKAVGVGPMLEGASEKMEDFTTAILLSHAYMGASIKKHSEEALWNALEGLATLLLGAGAILAVTTAVGALIGAFFGGAGALPGAAIGFEIGMILIEWLGLAMLTAWVGESLWDTCKELGTFVQMVWMANGDMTKLEEAAKQFAEAVGVFLEKLIEGLIMFGAAKGASVAMKSISGSKLGPKVNETKAGYWLQERMRRFNAHEGPMPRPREALTDYYSEPTINRANGPKGQAGDRLAEFDGFDVKKGLLIEHKKATGFNILNPKTGKPQQTPTKWARAKIFDHTSRKIDKMNLAMATGTQRTAYVKIPDLHKMQNVRKLKFKVDGNSPSLRQAVLTEVVNLQAKYPDWEFSAEFGTELLLPTVPANNQQNE